MTHAWLAAVLARAGGGQNFGGGGSAGGGGGGSFGTGGGGGGGGFFFVPFFGGGGGGAAAGSVIALIFLVALAAVVLMLVRAWLRSSTRTGAGASAGAGGAPLPFPPSRLRMQAGPAAYDDTHPIGVPERFRGDTLPGSSSGAAGVMEPGGVRAGIDEIHAHDPAFDETAFVGQAEKAFFVVQQAWSELKPEMSRRVMADGLWQQHKVQIDQYREAGRQNKLDNLSVGKADVIGAHSDQSYDTITVRFLAACADYDVDAKSGKVVRGDQTVRQWSEDWIFQRSSQAVTKEGGGTLGDRCPNCGAPLDVDIAGVCSYCKAPVMSGKYDWVLSRIEQVF